MTNGFGKCYFDSEYCLLEIIDIGFLFVESFRAFLAGLAGYLLIAESLEVFSSYWVFIDSCMGVCSIYRIGLVL